MNIGGSFQPVAGNWPIYFLKGNRRCKHFSLMQKQSHFLRQGKKQRGHYVTTLFSMFVLLFYGVIWQHELPDSIWAKQEFQKTKRRNSEVHQTSQSMDVPLGDKASVSGIHNSAQISSPNLFHHWHWNFQRSKHFFCCTLSVFLYLGFSRAIGILYRAVKV